MNQCSCQCEVDEQVLYGRLNEIIEKYKVKEGSLIQALHAAQALFGYLPDKALSCIAEGFNVPISEVTGVVSFYTVFSTTPPPGGHIIQVCVGAACYAKGANKLLEKIEEHLGIKVGETTLDGKFSLRLAHHVGLCGLAPVMMIDGTVYRQVEVDKVAEILNTY